MRYFPTDYFLPLRYAPLEIELELADRTDPIITKLAAASAGATAFKVDNTSTSWKIQKFMVKVDLCTLDNAL